jgi:hypothetical protein
MSKICSDCQGFCDVKDGGRRVRCYTCNSLLCVWCYREHKDGNKQVTGGCAAHMDGHKKKEGGGMIVPIEDIRSGKVDPREVDGVTETLIVSDEELKQMFGIGRPKMWVGILIAAVGALLLTAVAVFGTVNQIVIKTELEQTRATVSCTDGKAPNIKHLTSPTNRAIVILDCERSK